MNDKDLNAKTTEVRRVLPVMLKVENLHIHLDERSTSNTYFNGAEEEEPDIDIEAMIDAIATKTGLCKQAVMMVLDAESEYLDSVYGEDDEVDEDVVQLTSQSYCGRLGVQKPHERRKTEWQDRVFWETIRQLRRR